MNKKNLLLAVAAIAAVALLAVLAIPPDVAPGDVAIAYALGGKGDQSYNDAAVSGVELLRGQGYRVVEYEPPSLDQYREGLEVLARSKPKVIFCVGYLYNDMARSIAGSYPNTAFVVLDGEVAAPNAWSLRFRADEGSKLAGAVAAALSNSKKVAFIGGMDIPAIAEFRKGFELGVGEVNPEVTIDSYYVGSTPAGFTDPVKGKEIGVKAINAGADVLFHAAGTSGNGVIDACKQHGRRAIGVDVDQKHLAPDTVITSVIKKFGVAMDFFMRERQAGRLTEGTVITLGYKQGAVDITPIDRPESDPVIQAVDRVRRGLLSPSE